MGGLRRGDLLPRVSQSPPGPRSRRLSRQLQRYEAPGINTLGPGGVGLVWQEARGANVLDVDGNRYVDFTSGFGVAAVGHRHPAVVAAVRQQSDRLIHGLADVHAHPARIELAKQLGRMAPIDEPQVYFAVSGSDAVEIALKTALLATGKAGIVAFEPAYHGLTLGALQATSRDWFRRRFKAHFHSRVHRLPYGCPVRKLEALLRQGGTACVLVEPIVGREGVLLPPTGWLSDLRRLCDRHRCLLVVDEIFTGFGRTGPWFAVQHERVVPDLICCGKALGGGLPIAAVIGHRRWMGAWDQPGEALHSATFVAHPVACCAGLAVIATLRSERLPQRSSRLGRWLAKRMDGWSHRISGIDEVRGRGLFWGIELRSENFAKGVVSRLLGLGVLALAGGPEGRVLQLVPPLTIARRQLEFALDSIESVLQEEG